MLIGRLRIKASRWPWQDGFNWHGTSMSAPINAKLPGEKAAPRFGGGWKYKLGFALSGRTLMIDLLFGIVTFTLYRRSRCGECAARVDAYHAHDCSRFRRDVPATSWMNKVDGFRKDTPSC